MPGARVIRIGEELPETTDSVLHNLNPFTLQTSVDAREQAYLAFQKDPALQALTEKDRLAGTRVYTNLPMATIAPTLSRRAGYAISPDERHHTKERVIASQAHYIANSSGDFHPDEPVAATMLTSCAPNLRKGENPGDLNAFTHNGQLNEDSYRTEMQKVWTRFFHAANEEAKAKQIKTDVLTPLAGGGAYLDSLSDADKVIAKAIIAETMIAAANTPGFDNIAAVHLSIPNGRDEKESRDFALIEGIMKRTSASEKTITLSNTEMLTLGKELSETGADISICNPGSDHVPGGGAYNDRGDRRLNGSNGYKENEGATPEHPGSFNRIPTALEEQLGQVSNFLYVQNKDQNMKSFTFVPINQRILQAPLTMAVLSKQDRIQIGQDIGQLGVSRSPMILDGKNKSVIISFTTKADADRFAKFLSENDFPSERNPTVPKTVHSSSDGYHQIYFSAEKFAIFKGELPSLNVSSKAATAVATSAVIYGFVPGQPIPNAKSTADFIASKTKGEAPWIFAHPDPNPKYQTVVLSFKSDHEAQDFIQRFQLKNEKKGEKIIHRSGAYHQVWLSPAEFTQLQGIHHQEMKNKCDSFKNAMAIKRASLAAVTTANEPAQPDRKAPRIR